MDVVKKTLLLFLAFFIWGTKNCLLCHAENIAPIQVIEEIEMPQEINFTVNNTCAGHAYFMQATANESGDFAIYTRHVNLANGADVDFNKVYVDLYQYDGKFMHEISFITPLDLAIELEENVVNIYFYDFMLVYNIEAQEVFCYSILEGEVVNGGLYKQLRSKTFSAGDWTYNCKKAIDGYTELTRSNGEQVQVLVELSGTGDFWRGAVLLGGGIGAICMIIIIWRVKRKQL